MRALLRKDRAWLVVCMLGGVATLTTSLLQHHLAYVFDIGQSLDYLFHAAWIAGLVLGLVAATFDECLGTQEFLRQRPVGLLRVHAARIAACGLVLLTWFVVPPLLAVGIEQLAGYSKYWGGWQVRPGRLEELAATMSVAVSACGIGLWSGAMPLHFAWRAVFGAAVLLAGFGTIEELAENPSRVDDLRFFVPFHLVGPRTFLVGHLLLGTACVAASFVAATASRDDDHALPRRLRSFAIPVAVVAVAVLGSGIATELQMGQLLRLLFRTYPRVELRGESARLVRPVEVGKELLLQPVDAQHHDVGEPEPNAKTMTLLFWVPLRGPGFDQPRWERRARGVWHPGSIGFQLSSRGDVLVEDDRVRRESWWTGKGEAQARFVPGSWVHWLGDGATSLAVEPAPGGPWRVDEEAGCFVPLPLPEADRIRDYWIVEGTLDGVGQSDGRMVQRVRGHRETRGTLVARGEHATYVVDAAGFRPAPEVGKRLETSVRLVVIDPDPIAPRVEVQDGAGRVRFAHDYAPRTAEEAQLAGLAVAVGISLRPPVLLGLAHALPPSARRSALMDPLVAGGRRTWIVLAGFAVGCLCAGLSTFRLRRLGAPRATWQYWAVLNVLFGPAALLASLVFERRRAYRTLPPLGAIEPPRIVTQPVPLEVIA